MPSLNPISRLITSAKSVTASSSGGKSDKRKTTGQTKFSYEAINSSGSKVSGTEEAATEQALINKLLALGLQPIKIKKQHTLEGLLHLHTGPKLTQDDLLFFTRELADLLEAGVPLERSMTVIADSTDKPAVKELVTTVRRDIQGGKGLSGALSNHPALFDKLYVNMVTVGEMGGVLPEVLRRLGTFLERSRQIRRFILTSSIYPGMLLLVGFASVTILVTFVVPKFGQIFKDLNQPMPLATELIVNTSSFIKDWWWMIAAFIAVAVGGLYTSFHTPNSRIWWDKTLLRLPLAGGMILRMELARLTRTLGTLLESGVPILSSISLASDVLENSQIRAQMEVMHKGVRQGRALSQIMKQSSLFPPLVVHLVSIGEETGDMGKMLLKVADDLDEKIQHDTKLYLSMVEPVTIVVMGLLIGGIILSMLLAIFGINDVSL
ncbi:MAG: type II secretion system F family protein [Dissulfuribacterales bacterium]